LLSVSHITQAEYSLDFKDKKCHIFNKKHHQIRLIPYINGLYRLYVQTSHLETYHIDDGPYIITLNELHCLIGHLSINTAKKLIKDQLVDGLKLDKGISTSKEQYPLYLHGRIMRKVMSKTRENNASERVDDQVHSDIWGPVIIETLQHKKYYVTFTDN
ncbi:uncharacterized protein BT62DRAFT_877093, partial [Guyanagaster necrorhizus]